MEWSGLCDDEGAESVKAKTFFIAALSCVLALLLGTAAAVAWIDPMLTVGGLKEGETALFVNERYEMAGLLRSQEYSNLVMGTSLVANYRASWFEEGLGEKTFQQWIEDANCPQDLIDRVQADFKLGGHKAAAIAMVLANADVYLVSEMPEELTRKCFLTPFASAQAALDAAFARLGASAKVLAMPYGGSTLPQLV